MVGERKIYLSAVGLVVVELVKVRIIEEYFWIKFRGGLFIQNLQWGCVAAAAFNLVQRIASGNICVASIICHTKPTCHTIWLIKRACRITVDGLFLLGYLHLLESITRSSRIIFKLFR